jgi:DNA modification methylase
MKKQKGKKMEFKNHLYYGDNLEVLRKYIKDESIDLCYIDPPFNSKRNYNQIYLNQGSEDKAQAQAFIDTWTWNDMAEKEYHEILDNEKAFYSKQTVLLIEGLTKVLDKGNLMAYLVSMTIRIAEIHRVLKQTGSFYLHCDPTASHYLKLVCDSIFCAKGGDFKNEIIWHYSGWNAILKDSFNKRHDSILLYTKSDNSTFNGYSEKWESENQYIKIRKQKVMIDINGKKYVMSDAGNGNRVKRYLDDAMKYGKPVSNVWVLDKINNSSKEKLGYPTQKPESLLERIIETSSIKNDVILDAFCGCGTTIAVAQKMKRNWIGIDITYQSISLMLHRLENTFGDSILEKIELNGVPKDFESAVALANKIDDRTRKEFEKWAVLTYSKNRAIINDKKGKDFGIDGNAFIMDFQDNKKSTHELKPIIFSVKSDLKPKPSYVRDLIGTMQRENAVMGIMILLHEPTKDMILEAKKQGKYTNNMFDLEFDKVEIVTVNEILEGKRLRIPKNIETKVVKSADRKIIADADQGKLDM